MATLSPFLSLPQIQALTTNILHSPPPPSFPCLSPPPTFRFSRFAIAKVIAISSHPQMLGVLSSSRSQLNSYAGDEARRIVEEAFSFSGGDDDLADGDDGEEEEEEEVEVSSVELLLRFLQSMVKKVSRRAKRASRSVLPPAISSQLVSFAVDGLMLLASLSIVKALLEVVCTLGGTVFVAILLLRVSWSALSYFQSSGGSPYTPTQPVT